MIPDIQWAIPLILCVIVIISVVAVIALLLVRLSDRCGWLDPAIKEEHPGLFKRAMVGSQRAYSEAQGGRTKGTPGG